MQTDLTQLDPLEKMLAQAWQADPTLKVIPGPYFEWNPNVAELPWGGFYAYEGAPLKFGFTKQAFAEAAVYQVTVIAETRQFCWAAMQAICNVYDNGRGLTVPSTVHLRQCVRLGRPLLRFAKRSADGTTIESWVGTVRYRIWVEKSFGSE